MLLAVQYYRPPFPEKKYWKNDFARIRDIGLDAIQLWLCWGWVEPEPGLFRFDDYDELIEAAEQAGLGIILSTIAEIQPFWIHRIEPDAYMVDHKGNRVDSMVRSECNVGLTPGGCIDHAGIQKRMQIFFEKTAQKYASLKNLKLWDCWNENRWCVHADAHVCYCPATVSAYRQWLKNEYGDLDNLNRTWKRRYASWDDVFPGRLPRRHFTDVLEFFRFLTWRAKEHARFRSQIIRSCDPVHPVFLHTDYPVIRPTGEDFEAPLSRGNDWEIAEVVDGIGSSQYLSWKDDVDFTLGLHLEAIRSAAHGKTVWVGEAQGGSARACYDEGSSIITPKIQQRCIWNSIARGAKALNFWCWRDEVFGMESASLGLSGQDGFAPERIAALKKTIALIKKHNALFDEYFPDRAKVGVLFTPHNYYLDWAQHGNIAKSSASLQGYALALERAQIPYEIVEANHLDVLTRLKIIFLPRSQIILPKTIEHLIGFINNGGVVFCEAETNSFTPQAFYCYPDAGRTLMDFLGIRDKGWRYIEAEERCLISLDSKSFLLPLTGLITPLEGNGAEAAAQHKLYGPLMASKSVGQGRAYVLGAFAGHGYFKKRNVNFEKMIVHIVSKAGAMPELCVNPKKEIIWRTGVSGRKRLLFVLNAGKSKKIAVTTPCEWLSSAALVDLVNGKKAAVSFRNSQAIFQLGLEQNSYNIYQL